MSDRVIGNFEFALAGPPDSCPESLQSRAIRLRLSEQEWRRKLRSARQYREIFGDVSEALGRWGEAAFQTEILCPVNGDDEKASCFAEPPFYEVYGERQVAAGYYASVLRYRDHFLPVAEAVRRHAGVL